MLCFHRPPSEYLGMYVLDNSLSQLDKVCEVKLENTRRKRRKKKEAKKKEESAVLQRQSCGGSFV